MLYLEDYLEMIEHLPQELRDRFTEMRELDLSVQNNMDDLEKRVKILFNEWKRNPSDLPQTADLEFEVIRKEYCKTLEDQDEKVVLANQMYELVDRYLRRLDTELHKFKCELEADNKGITELLEKRSLELDTPMTNTTSSQKENRYERYSSSRTREKRRSDSCQNSGGVTYPEKRPHLSHTLSMGEQRLTVGATTNGNNVLLASQLQGHLHGISQSQQLGSISNTSTNTSNNSYYHSNSHSTSMLHSTSNILNSSHNQQNATTLSTNNSHGTTNNNNSTNPNVSIISAQQSATHVSSNHSNVSSSSQSALLMSTGSNNVAGTAVVSTTSGANYNLVSGGAGPAIAAAASQAIAATQKMQQGRRTPSLKASYEAINSSSSCGGLVKVNDMAIGRELAGAAQTAIQAIQHDSNKKRNTKKYSSTSSSHHHHSASSSSSSSHRHQMSGGGGTSSASSSNHQSVTGVSSSQPTLSLSASSTQQQIDLVSSSDVDSYMDMGRVTGAVSGGGGADDGMGGAGDDLGAGEYIDSYDPNEPRYCLCNQVSYGDMVACDNEDCPSEWFHYPCVGITAPPKGKWYCPQCTSSMRRRGSRKN